MGPCTSVPVGVLAHQVWWLEARRQTPELSQWAHGGKWLELKGPCESGNKWPCLVLPASINILPESDSLSFHLSYFTLHYQFKSQICKICSRCHEGAGVETRYHSSLLEAVSSFGLVIPSKWSGWDAGDDLIMHDWRPVIINDRFERWLCLHAAVFR